MKRKLCTLFVAGSLMAGCQTYDPYTGEKEVSKSTTGGIIGAVAGAAVGAATSSKKDRAKGALIGAAAGGAIGGGIGYYMDKQEAELRRKLEGTGVRVVRNGDEITLVMPGNITFDTGRAEVKSQFYGTLESVALVLGEFEKTMIEVSGHTDSTGSREINERLSVQRAEAVGNFLVSQGVSANRIQALGFADRYPVATNNTAEGRTANRRVELKLIPIAQNG